MNLEYLSEITSERTPKNLTIFSKKRIATKKALRAPSSTKRGVSLLYLVNQSTQVKIALFPLQRCRSKIKSILQDTNLPFRIGNGYKKPG